MNVYLRKEGGSFTKGSTGFGRYGPKDNADKEIDAEKFYKNIRHGNVETMFALVQDFIRDEIHSECGDSYYVPYFKVSWPGDGHYILTVGR